MRIPFEYIGALQQENKILKKENSDLKSGERFKQIQRKHQKLINAYRRQVKQLQLVIEGLRKDVKNAWKWCEEAYEDALKEQNASMKELKRALKEKDKERLAAEHDRDQALSKITGLCRENSELKTQLDDAQGRNKKLLAQLNRDYENSSIPSSQSRNRSKIPNNRECTGRKPGAQPGHVHHGRKKQVPTQTVCLPAPEDVAKDPDFKKTNKTIIKQLISITFDGRLIRCEIPLQKVIRFLYFPVGFGDLVRLAFGRMADSKNAHDPVDRGLAWNYPEIPF